MDVKYYALKAKKSQLQRRGAKIEVYIVTFFTFLKLSGAEGQIKFK
jgi:hypothetical protein